MCKYYIKIIGIWIRVPKKIFYSKITCNFWSMQKYENGGEWDNQKEEPLILMTEEEVKQYFERKVKDG